MKSSLFYEGGQVYGCRVALSCVGMNPERAGEDAGERTCSSSQRLTRGGPRDGTQTSMTLCVCSCLGATVDSVADDNVVAKAAHGSHCGALLTLDNRCHPSLSH